MTFSLFKTTGVNQGIPVVLPAKRMQPHTKIIVAIFLATVFTSVVNISVARADTATDSIGAISQLAQSAPSRSGDRRGPPPREAIAACADQAAQSVCSFAGRDGMTIEGTCQSPEASAPVACIPALPPRNG
jgi:hypothetical protein